MAQTRRQLRGTMGSRVSRRQGMKTRAGLKEIRLGKKMRPRARLQQLLREDAAKVKLAATPMKPGVTVMEAAVAVLVS